MIKWIKQLTREKRLRYYERCINSYWGTLEKLKYLVNDYRKENQSLSGQVKILEEQQEIMHNFLVEINKYLVNLAEKDKK